MADAYGVLVLTQSDDSIIDGNQLVNTLNSFRWDFSGGEWEWDEESKSIFHDQYSATYPTICPDRIAKFECMSEEDGTEYFKSYDEMCEEDWGNVVDEQYEEIDLAEIKKVLGKHISQGWIEIFCRSNEKDRYATISSLRIEAGGNATRRNVFWSARTGIETTEETI
jgi:hypothetical protein